MRKLPLILLLPILAVLPALWAPAQGQAPIQPQVLYAKQRQIKIPFDPDPAEMHRLKQLQLYYSNDLGKSWNLGATAAPEQRNFNFIAETDGLYLFAVQTTDTNNRQFPEKMEGVTPQLRVVIDTVPPTITLKPLPSRPNEVGVSWEVRDANLDLSVPDSILLWYRPTGSNTWTPLVRTPGATQHYWNPGTSGVVEVRLKARDLAGHTNEATTNVSLGKQGGFGGPVQGGNNPVHDPPGSGAVSLDPDRRFLNNKTITLNYEISEKGPSGVSGIDLWVTEDGRSWSKMQLPKTAQDPTFMGPLTFSVPGEGVYGFTLIARSGVGLSERPPQVGDKPQVWIEIDLTKPVVELQSVLVGEGDNKGKLSIAWSARDKNFGKTPIALSYGTQNTGPWNTFAERLPNTGHYIWKMLDRDMPWQFYLKVEATDLAGNIGEAITPGLVKVDLFQPKAKILDVQPAGK